MRWYKADLHIHSVLSPCGSLEMSPQNVMKTAHEKGLDIIAITDHNSCANSRVYAETAAEFGLAYIYGIEVQTAEEIHVVALFDNADNACRFGQEVYDSLLPIDNDPDFFGDQVVIDSNDNIKEFLPKALINSSVWSLEETLERIISFEGFYFPAHVDVTSYSLLGQLGFIPSHTAINTVGVTANCDLIQLTEQYPFLQNMSFVRNSDAHYLKDIGSGYSEFYLQEPTLQEIIMACNKQNYRKIKKI